MAELNDWQWAIGAAVLVASLVLGGWLNRERIEEGVDNDHQAVEEPATPDIALPTSDSIELKQLRQQLEARDSELQDAREEAELTLLQLHQVQEELEQYFLKSRDLQQKLDAVQTITPEQQAQRKRINTRLLELFKTLPASSANSTAHAPSGFRLEALLQRQQNALRRFQALQKAN